MPHKSIVLTTIGTLTLSLSLSCSARAEESCRAYMDSSRGVDDEINNCPITKDNFSLRGTFANSNWQASFWAYEPAYYILHVKNNRDGSTINLTGFNVKGTIERPQYQFTDEVKNITYIVTFQYTDPDTIRLEMYQNDRAFVNELLARESNELIGGP
jgi:hypothetical protein